MFSARTFLKLEITGGVLLLVSIGWQLFLSDPLSEVATRADFYELHEKIDVIWNYLGFIGSKVGDSSVASSGYGQHTKSYGRAQAGDRKLRQQQELLRIVASILYLIGSALVLLGEYGVKSAKLVRRE